MKEFWSFIIKETKHITRDKRTMMILFGMPIIQMLIFGFAISTDVRNVRTVVVTSQVDHQTQRIVDALDQSEYFNVMYQVHTPAEAEQIIRNQKSEMGVVYRRYRPQYGTAIQQLCLADYGYPTHECHAEESAKQRFSKDAL